MSFEECIDTHAHFIPPFYRTACEETGHGKPDGMPAIPVRLPRCHEACDKQVNHHLEMVP